MPGTWKGSDMEGWSLSKDNHGTLGDTLGRAWEAAQGQGEGAVRNHEGSAEGGVKSSSSSSLMPPRQKIGRHIQNGISKDLLTS